MNLFEKIEKIRQEPEPVRVRYVITSVSISMFFMVAIWLFSLAASFQNLIPHVPASAKKVTESLTVSHTDSLKNLIDIGAKLEEEMVPKNTMAEDPIQKLDPNFGQHPIPDNVPKKENGNPVNPLSGEMPALPTDDDQSVSGAVPDKSNPALSEESSRP